MDQRQKGGQIYAASDPLSLEQETQQDSCFLCLPLARKEHFKHEEKEKECSIGFHGLVCSYELASFCMCSLVTKDSKSIGICIHSKFINSKCGLRGQALGHAGVIRHPEGSQNTGHLKDDSFLFKRFISVIYV